MVEGVLALDTEGRLLTINRAGAEMLRVNPAAVQKLSIQEVVSNPDLRWFVNRLLSAREPIEGEVTLKEDGPRVLQVHGTALRDPEGMVMGTLVVLHDITHLRRLETARRDFVANVSHELKTPITSIKGFVETLLAGALTEPENAARFLRIIAQQTDRLNEIIDDLLSLSRIEQEAERYQIAFTRGNLKGVLQAAGQVCEAKAAAKNISIQVNCPDELRASFNAPLLEQALVNLIDNAIKFSPADSTVRVEAQESRVGDRYPGQGPGRRHCAGAPGPDLRALLPGGCGPQPERWAAPAWDWPSSNTSPRPTAAGSRWTALRGRAVLSLCTSRPIKKPALTQIHQILTPS